MNEETGSATVLLVGALLVRLSASGIYTRYVRAEMGVWLLLTGIILAVVGAAGVAYALLRPQETVIDPHHDHTERIGWLLLCPVVALLMVSPPALGSYGVDRSTVVAVSSGGRTFDVLPGGTTTPMTVLEFDQRAADNGGASFGSASVRLVGFVARTDDAGGFRLARYQIACCAADAVAAVVRVVGVAGDPPGLDTWVIVTGTFRRSNDDVPELAASSLVQIPPPVDPYES